MTQEFIRPGVAFTFAQLPNWLAWRKEVSPEAKLVYAKLVQYAGDRLTAFPRIDKLALHVGLERRTAQRKLKELVELGLLSVVEEKQDRRKPTIFKFPRHPWMSQLAPGAKGPVLRRTAADADDVDDEADAEDFEGEETLASPVSQAPLRHGSRETHDTVVASDASPVSRLIRERSEEIPFEKIQPKKQASASPSTCIVSSADSDSDPTPFDLNKDPEGAATAEPGSTEDFIARARAKSSHLLTRPLETMQAAAQKSAEARAQRSAKRTLSDERRKELAEAQQEMGAEPVEAPGSTPLGYLFGVWVSEMKESFPQFPMPRRWSPRENGQAKMLLEKYAIDQVEIALVYVIRNWEALGQRFFKDRADPAPTVGVVLALDATIFPQSVVWAQHGKVIEEYEAYGPSNVRRPSELLERYLEASKQLKSLGLNV